MRVCFFPSASSYERTLASASTYTRVLFHNTHKLASRRSLSQKSPKKNIPLRQAKQEFPLTTLLEGRDTEPAGAAVRLGASRAAHRIFDNLLSRCSGLQLGLRGQTAGEDHTGRRARGGGAEVARGERRAGDGAQAGAESVHEGGHGELDSGIRVDKRSIGRNSRRWGVSGDWRREGLGERGWEDWDYRVVGESRDTGQIYHSLLELLA